MYRSSYDFVLTNTSEVLAITSVLDRLVSTYMSCGRVSIVKSYKFKAIKLNIILFFERPERHY